MHQLSVSEGTLVSRRRVFQDLMKRTLSVLVDITAAHALLLKTKMSEFCDVMLGVASAEATSLSCKRVALEV